MVRGRVRVRVREGLLEGGRRFRLAQLALLPKVRVGIRARVRLRQAQSFGLGFPSVPMGMETATYTTEEAMNM